MLSWDSFCLEFHWKTPLGISNCWHSPKYRYTHVYFLSLVQSFQELFARIIHEQWFTFIQLNDYTQASNMLEALGCISFSVSWNSSYSLKNELPSVAGCQAETVCHENETLVILCPSIQLCTVHAEHWSSNDARFKGVVQCLFVYLSTKCIWIKLIQCWWRILLGHQETVSSTRWTSLFPL